MVRYTVFILIDLAVTRHKDGGFDRNRSSVPRAKWLEISNKAIFFFFSANRMEDAAGSIDTVE